MRALLFHAPAYTADGYDDTRPRLVRAACKGSDNNVERRDIPENGLSVSDWYLRNISAHILSASDKYFPDMETTLRNGNDTKKASVL